MKAFVLALLVSGSAMAEVQPNKVNCSDVNDPQYKVSYETKSTTTLGKLKVVDNGQQLVPENNAQYRVQMTLENTRVGRVVTAASIDRKMIADVPVLLYSLIVPNFVPRENLKIPFNTILISGYSGGFRRPPFAVQVIKEVRNLACEASISPAN